LWTCLFPLRSNRYGQRQANLFGLHPRAGFRPGPTPKGRTPLESIREAIRTARKPTITKYRPSCFSWFHPVIHLQFACKAAPNVHALRSFCICHYALAASKLTARTPPGQQPVKTNTSYRIGGRGKSERPPRREDVYMEQKPNSWRQDMKKITEITNDKFTVKVVFDAEWKEFRCQLIVDGLHQGEETDYHTDDKEDAIQTAEIMVKEAQKKEHRHTLKKGDIIYNSWGYDQTNIDFFQVVKITKCFVVLRPIHGNKSSDGPTSMTGKSSAVKNEFTSEQTTRHKAVFWNGGNYIKFQYGGGSKWDGTPKRYSTYA